MVIAVRKENDSIYIDKIAYSRFSEEELSKPPYNFTKVEIDDKFADCEPNDFNDDLTFSEQKYNKRKKMLEIMPEINRLKQNLADSDYKTSKYVDGEYTEQEWQEIVAERKGIREQIRALEEEING